MILGFTPTPTTLLLNEAPSSRKQQGKKENPKEERKTQVTARCTKWIMLICGEKVQDEVLHRAAEEHNSVGKPKIQADEVLQRNKLRCRPIVTRKNSPRIEWLAAPVARNDDVTVQEEKFQE
jgi:hypothetical protein